MSSKDDVTKLLERLVATHGNSGCVRETVALVTALVEECAAQGQRLTGERLEAVQLAESALRLTHGNTRCSNALRAAFPELGEG